jgi:hypothetical protein
VCARRLVLALALGALAPQVQAMHPLLSEDTGTQGAGRFQLELVGERMRDRAAGVTLRTTQPEAVLAYGALEDLDALLGIGYLRQTSDNATGRTEQKGPIDTTLGVKWRFFERDALSLGLLPSVTLPSGDAQRGTGTGRATWGALAILSWERDRHALHAHLGVRRNRNTLDERQALREAAAALVLNATGRLKLAIEAHSETNADKAAGGSLRHATLALIYAVNKELDLDVGWRRGLNEAANDRTLLFGATLRW